VQWRSAVGARRLVAVCARMGDQQLRSRVAARRLVVEFINTVTHRGRRGAPPARRATEAYPRYGATERNAAGGDASAAECRRIYEFDHLARATQEVPSGSGNERRGAAMRSAAATSCRKNCDFSNKVPCIFGTRRFMCRVRVGTAYTNTRTGPLPVRAVASFL
jgi:hypothetical protein